MTILFLLLRPSDGEMGWLHQIPHFDKVVHFTLFLIWAILGSMAVLRLEFSNKSFVFLFAMVMTFAISTEWLQTCVPSRTADWRDVLADTAGGILGLVLTKFWKINQ